MDTTNQLCLDGVIRQLVGDQMRHLILTGCVCAAAILAPAAYANEELGGFHYCVGHLSDTNTLYVTQIMRMPEGTLSTSNWLDFKISYSLFLKGRHNAGGISADCWGHGDTAGAANEQRAEKIARYKRDYEGISFKYVEWLPEGIIASVPEAPRRNVVSDDTENQRQSTSKNAADAKVQRAADLAAERRRAHEEVEARNREKQAKYEADMKAWQAQIDAQKAEEERKQAKLAADKQLAAQQLAAFEAAQEAHRREVEKHAQLLMENRDNRQRAKLCSAGDRAACDGLANMFMEAAIPKKEAGAASTDTDARMCVTEPVLSPNEAFKGSIKAVVVNGCDKPVDVRICLMRTGGWNCGMRTALKPQEDWTWWTSNPQDGVFWDAKTTGSNRRLGDPS